MPGAGFVRYAIGPITGKRCEGVAGGMRLRSNTPFHRVPPFGPRTRGSQALEFDRDGWLPRSSGPKGALPDVRARRWIDVGGEVTVFIIRRLMQSAVVVFALTLVVFFSINIIGNPVDILIDPECDQECYRKAMENFGLDRPIHEQYFVFLENAVQGDFGDSFLNKIPATELIVERLPASLELAIFAMLITLVIGIPAGMWSGLRPESPSGKLIMGGSIVGFSLPGFWVGLMLIIIFSVELDLLPSTGRGETVEVLGIRISLLTLNGLSHLVLPAITLSLYHTALIMRLTRAGVREVVLVDFIKFAHAKGLAARRVVFVHVLKNILIPVVTVLGLEFGGLLAYGVVTETIFAWPGMGKLLIDSINILDRPVVVAYVMFIVLLFITINLLVDILYSVLDPRVRIEGMGK
jgi:peptide/nickel transport system permease protein